MQRNTKSSAVSFSKERIKTVDPANAYIRFGNQLQEAQNSECFASRNERLLQVKALTLLKSLPIFISSSFYHYASRTWTLITIFWCTKAPQFFILVMVIFAIYCPNPFVGCIFTCFLQWKVGCEPIPPVIKAEFPDIIKKSLQTHMFTGFFFWSWWSESNWQPAHYEWAALPLSHTSIWFFSHLSKSANIVYKKEAISSSRQAEIFSKKTMVFSFCEKHFSLCWKSERKSHNYMFNSGITYN